MYVALATSDAVVRDLRRDGSPDRERSAGGALPFQAAAVSSAVPDAITPMMTITGSRANGQARDEADGACNAGVSPRRRGAAGGCEDPGQGPHPGADRQELERPRTSLEPRSKALLMVVLLGGLIATVAAAFARDNVTAGKRRPEDDAGQAYARISRDSRRLDRRRGLRGLRQAPRPRMGPRLSALLRRSTLPAAEPVRLWGPRMFVARRDRRTRRTIAFPAVTVEGRTIAPARSGAIA